VTAGVLSAIGGTPLVALRRVLPQAGFELFAKLEALNPGGSIKDRAARQLLQAAIAAGKIDAGTVVVESSSGNMGIGLAQACAYFGLRFVCVVDPRTTAQNVAIMRAYGATIELVDIPDRNGGFLQARLERVRAIVAARPRAFWPDQYGNLDNALAHHQTMREIATALGGEVDYLFCATSTCGTIRGCADYVREHRLATRIVAVDAVGSVIFGRDGVDSGRAPQRLIPGHGAALRPALYRDRMATRCLLMSDRDCIVGCRRLVESEGILAGGSAGAALMAVVQMAHDIEDGARCVVVFPDRGERYLDTIYSDDWVRTHFGEPLPAWVDPLRDPSTRRRGRALGRYDISEARPIEAWPSE
jgi:2,3-diaminopropionate biosynthesis protein SbnA